MTAEMTILYDIGIILIAATVAGLIAKATRQPLIGAYVVAGLVIGPAGLGLVSDTDVIRMFAELGVAFLLFIVGLELDLSRLGEVRNVVIGAGLVGVVTIFLAGAGIMHLFGYGTLEAVYVGLFVTFSSTAVLVKLLSDSGDIDTLHGRIILGILLVQDIVVVLALSALSTLNEFSISLFASTMLKGAGLLALAVVLSKHVVPTLFGLIDDSHELVYLSSLTVLFAFVGLSVESGFSTAVGGFLAGIALTAFPYNVEIAERSRPMRDFFVTIFFVTLGMIISLSSIQRQFTVFVVLLGLVLFVKPLVINLLVSAFRYGKKASFLTGINLAQVSEFAVVLALTGASMGHIGTDVVSLATALMVATITASSYFNQQQNWLYTTFESFILEFEGDRHGTTVEDQEGHVVLCGAHRMGNRILRFLEESAEDVIVIDHDPEIIRAVEEKSVDTIYGDIEDAQVLHKANVHKAKAVISTVPNAEPNRYLLNYVRRNNDDAIVIVAANDLESALLLYEEGADYVLYPKMLAAKEAADMVEKIYEHDHDLEEARTEHVMTLEDEVEKEILKRYEPEFIRELKERMKGIGPK